MRPTAVTGSAPSTAPPKKDSCNSNLDLNEQDDGRNDLSAINSNNISGDLDCCVVKKSSIPNAGLGLFATRVILPGQRITKYSGRIISQSEAKASSSSYLLHVNSRACLDAEGPGHMVGRFTNEGVVSGKENNARFGSSQLYYWCTKSNRPWVPVIATKKILPGEEVFASYGNQVTRKNLPKIPDHGSDNDDSDANENDGDKSGRESDDSNNNHLDGMPDADNEKRDQESDVDDSKDEDWLPSPDQVKLSTETKDSRVHEALDSEWSKLKLNSKGEEDVENSSQDPKAYAEKWYENICRTVLEAADRVLPKRKSTRAPIRGTSERTKKLMAKRKRMNRMNSSRADFKKIQKAINDSCLKDYVEWVDSCVQEMEKANSYGDVRKIYNLVNKVSKKPKPPPSNLTTDEEGNLLKSPQDVVDMWERFLKNKFKATDAEASRPPLEPLPKARSEEDALQRKEFENALKRMGNAKATGPDEIPIEVYKKCPKLKAELFQFTKQVCVG